jgi:hypothetical protein
MILLVAAMSIALMLTGFIVLAVGIWAYVELLQEQE